MLSKSLKTDLSDLGALLQAHGRGKDRVLAHITPKEAALLKARGGRGSRNPKTGLLEFDDTGIENVTVTAPYIPQPDISGVASSTYTKPAQQVQPNVTPPTASDVKSSVDQSVLTSPLPATNDTPAVPSDGQTGFTVPDQQVTPTVNVPGVEQATVTGLRQMPDIAPLLPVDAAAATGGSDNKPVGLVFVALSSPLGDVVRVLRLHGSRATVRERAAQNALDLLRRHLHELPVDASPA